MPWGSRKHGQVPGHATRAEEAGDDLLVGAGLRHWHGYCVQLPDCQGGYYQVTAQQAAQHHHVT
ncbi:hypothetical protein [Streptomyces sp. NRRL F-5630]|uniref:hypothetical protein n=1 Tax=Streptomyces sp. NRRL F-5630 TaxID=1463864 RepID=UPI003D728EF5